MTTRNSASDFAFDYTRGNEQEQASPSGVWNRILIWLERFTDLRAEAAVKRLEQIDPSLASRIRAARTAQEESEGL